MKSLEGYQSILYSFIDELRKNHADSRRRIEQNEDGLRRMEEIIRKSDTRILQTEDIILHFTHCMAMC